MAAGGVNKVIKDVRVCKGRVDTSFYDDVTMIPDLFELDPSKRNLLVLDDIMLGPQNKAKAYFTRGRHDNVDVIYIFQSISDYQDKLFEKMVTASCCSHKIAKYCSHFQ